MTAADHVNTVREALELLGPSSHSRQVALAALDALQAQAEATAHMTRHVESLMAECDRLADALREIIAIRLKHPDDYHEIARAALAETEHTP